jgi:Spy/CpxP family protein refolding chaperone
MKKIQKSLIMIALLVVTMAAIGAGHSPARAQEQKSPQMRDDLEQFAMDLHVGMQRANLTDQQREQMRKDLQTMRDSRKNGDRMAGFRAMRNFHSILDSGAFQPEDQQRIKQDMQQLREAKEESNRPM